MLASLAFSALQNAGQKPPPPQALIEPETQQQQEALEDDALIIVKAMINAAKADGDIDQDEIQRIIGKLDDDGLTEEEKQFFRSESTGPADTQGLINAIGNRPDLAAQVYAASLLAIEVDTPAERRYLETLAAGLQLPAQSVSFIEKTLGMT